MGRGERKKKEVKINPWITVNTQLMSDTQGTQEVRERYKANKT